MHFIMLTTFYSFPHDSLIYHSGHSFLFGSICQSPTLIKYYMVSPRVLSLCVTTHQQWL